MHILRLDPNYNINQETISAVDSYPLVDAGHIDISFCERLYQNSPIYYANIPDSPNMQFWRVRINRYGNY